MNRKILMAICACVVATCAFLSTACANSSDKSNDGDIGKRVEGEYKTFGSYPQSDVTDLIGESLTDLQGVLPTSSDFRDWTNYEYYISGKKETAFMWYKDMFHNGIKYRAVYFNGYRPYCTNFESSENCSYQDDNGFASGKVYWFKFEPIEWRVIRKDNGVLTLLCEKIIDSQDYNYSLDNQVDGGKSRYANNYAYSSIRKWLNNEFYSVAFSESEKESIQIVTVDNSGKTTYNVINPYACENTRDKVYLLSFQDSKNVENGFNQNALFFDLARRKQNTDYAKVQGGINAVNEPYKDGGEWWLRSPDRDSSCSAHYVRNNGASEYSDNNVNLTCRGVVPVIRVKL